MRSGCRTWSTMRAANWPMHQVATSGDRSSSSHTPTTTRTRLQSFRRCSLTGAVEIHTRIRCVMMDSTAVPVTECVRPALLPLNPPQPDWRTDLCSRDWQPRRPICSSGTSALSYDRRHSPRKLGRRVRPLRDIKLDPAGPQGELALRLRCRSV